MSNEVTVVDYGLGNLFSVQRALEHCGAEVHMSSDPDEILQAPRVLLPGVGAFADGMEKLRARGLNLALRELAGRGTPLLGICLGMQLLFDASEEFGLTLGLGLIPGRVVPIPATTTDGRQQKIPHIGWNKLIQVEGGTDWNNTLLTDTKPGTAVYFAHSFMAQPARTADRIAECLYGGHIISAAIGQGNVTGCQFHPEKSGQLGLRMLYRFLHMH